MAEPLPPTRSRIPGSGLAKGLAVTLRTMTKKTVTAQYPEAQPELPPRTRGVIGLFEENCTVCMLCARECPDWCIYIDSHKETVPPAAPGGRERSRNVLDRFAIDFSLCMYCGICIEVCPFDALFWSPEFEYAETDIHELTHERDKLREWMWTVPAPPALDPAAEEPKEIAAARKTADKLAAEQAARAEAAEAEATQAKAAETKSGAAQADPTQADPAEGDPAQGDPAQGDPAQGGQAAAPGEPSAPSGEPSAPPGQPSAPPGQPEPPAAPPSGPQEGQS
ncbi:4Fe-4S binding protein [Streptomyces sp. NPDC001910]|uniref:NuoI/complex I 23 kDa subunit family protein n=1 Tax=Streptomyces sp. NPDC001910 TaxID=3154403 RepID=UPI003325BC35